MQFVSKVEQLIKDSNSSHFPFGQSFLVAKGITVTDEELLSDISPSASITISEGLLTGSDYAVRLAAQSSMFGMGVGGENGFCRSGETDVIFGGGTSTFVGQVDSYGRVR